MMGSMGWVEEMERRCSKDESFWSQDQQILGTQDTAQ